MIGSQTNTEKYLYLIVVLATLSILSWVVYAPGFSFYLPRVYHHDGLFTGVGIKTIIETGWVLHNPYLGAPWTYNLADYPQSDAFSFLLIKFLSLLNHHYVIVMNLFYFLTFPLVSIVSLFAFRRLGLNSPFAIVAAILFSFLPYHLIRDEGHLYLCTYYVIPLYVLLILAVFNNETFTRKKLLIYAIVCCVAASSGIYYAFFACYFLLMAGLLTGVALKTWEPLKKCGILIFMIATVVSTNISPTVLTYLKADPNKVVAHRSPNETEYLSLKITQLLLPVDGHRIGWFNKIKKKYNRTAFLINENTSATLGLVGSCGFLILLGVLLIKRGSLVRDTLYQLSCLNILALLFATMGGFGVIFSFLITPMMRSQNRMSVFIAFFSLAAFFLVLQRLMRNQRQFTIFLLAAIIMVFGILDQIGSHDMRPNYAAIQTEFMNDKNFVAQIEHRPNQKMIFQLPITNFPENAVVNRMQDYELFKGYLHSHHLRWSYGAMKGRETFKWQKTVSELPLQDMLNNLVKAGFTGIYIDREGYTDQAAQLEKNLSTLLKSSPIESMNKKFIFFDLTSYQIG